MGNREAAGGARAFAHPPVQRLPFHRYAHRRSLPERLGRALRQLNETIEVLCVHTLEYVNVLFAMGFVSAYVAMVLRIFQGADWNDPTHSACG